MACCFRYLLKIMALISTSGLTSGQKRCAKLLWPNLCILRKLFCNADLNIRHIAMSHKQIGLGKGWEDPAASEYSTPHAAVLATEGATWFCCQSFHTLSSMLYLFFTCSQLHEMPKPFVFPKEEYCSLYSFYNFTWSPYSEQPTQGSNLLLI